MLLYLFIPVQLDATNNDQFTILGPEESFSSFILTKCWYLRYMLHTSYNVGTFGSGSGWIHIQIDAWIRIRIRHTDLDPDPESEIEQKNPLFCKIFMICMKKSGSRSRSVEYVHESETLVFTVCIFRTSTVGT